MYAPLVKELCAINHSDVWVSPVGIVLGRCPEWLVYFSPVGSKTTRLRLEKLGGKL